MQAMEAVVQELQKKHLNPLMKVLQDRAACIAFIAEDCHRVIIRRRLRTCSRRISYEALERFVEWRLLTGDVTFFASRSPSYVQQTV